MGYLKDVEKAAASKHPGMPVPPRKYVYHVTRKSLMPLIAKNGMKPQYEDLWATKHSSKEARTKESKTFFVPNYDLSMISLPAEDVSEFFEDDDDQLYLLRVDFDKIKEPLWSKDKEWQKVEMWTYYDVPKTAISYTDKLDALLDDEISRPTWKPLSSFKGKVVKKKAVVEKVKTYTYQGKTFVLQDERTASKKVKFTKGTKFEVTADVFGGIRAIRVAGVDITVKRNQASILEEFSDW